MSIPLLGTLGLVLRAKRSGLVPAARPVLQKLVDAGMYLSPEIIARSLALVGE